MSEISFKVLDYENTKELLEYEKGLYKSFFETKHDKVKMQKNFIIKDGNRLIPLIPYEDLIIYQGYLDNKLVCANAINISTSTFDIENIGFSFSFDKTKAEGLNMFFQNVEGDKAIRIGNDFLDYVLIDLKKKGYDTLVSSCTKKLKALYLLFDFEVIDSKMIDGEEHFLLKYNM